MIFNIPVFGIAFLKSILNIQLYLICFHKKKTVKFTSKLTSVEMQEALI